MTLLQACETILQQKGPLREYELLQFLRDYEHKGWISLPTIDDGTIKQIIGGLVVAGHLGMLEFSLPETMSDRQQLFFCSGTRLHRIFIA